MVRLLAGLVSCLLVSWGTAVAVDRHGEAVFVEGIRDLTPIVLAAAGLVALIVVSRQWLVAGIAGGSAVLALLVWSRLSDASLPALRDVLPGALIVAGVAVTVSSALVRSIRVSRRREVAIRAVLSRRRIELQASSLAAVRLWAMFAVIDVDLRSAGLSTAEIRVDVRSLVSRVRILVPAGVVVGVDRETVFIPERAHGLPGLDEAVVEIYGVVVASELGADWALASSAEPTSDFAP